MIPCWQTWIRFQQIVYDIAYIVNPFQRWSSYIQENCKLNILTFNIMRVPMVKGLKTVIKQYTDAGSKLEVDKIVIFHIRILLHVIFTHWNAFNTEYFMIPTGNIIIKNSYRFYTHHFIDNYLYFIRIYAIAFLFLAELQQFILPKWLIPI